MRRIFAICAVGALALAFQSSASFAQSAIPMPAEAPPATAAPDGATGTAEAAKPPAPKKSTKKAKAAVKCEELFEAACKEAPNCAWSNGLAKADGSAPKPECAKIDKTATKGTKDSCPGMFEALCRETTTCTWTEGAPDSAGKPTAGACAYTGKAKKTAAAKKPTAPAEPPPDSFTDQQAQ